MRHNNSNKKIQGMMIKNRKVKCPPNLAMFCGQKNINFNGLSRFMLKGTMMTMMMKIHVDTITNCNTIRLSQNGAHEKVFLFGIEREIFW